MPRTIIITGANNRIGLALTKALLEMGDCLAALHIPLENFGITAKLVAEPEKVERNLAKLVGRTAPVLAPGLVTFVQFWMSYHLPVPMGRKMARLADKARQPRQQKERE